MGIFKDKPVKKSMKGRIVAGLAGVALLVFLFAGPHTRRLRPGDDGEGGVASYSLRQFLPGNPAAPKPSDPPGMRAASVSARQASPKPEDDNLLTTQYKCFQSAEFAEICVYDLLCFDGNQAVIVSDKHPDWEPVSHHFQVGDNAAGSHTFDVYPRPPPKSEGLPVNTRMGAYYRQPASLFDGTTVIDWVDNAMWLVEPEYRSWDIQHIFFWAHSVFGLWEARISNSTWGNAMPPLDEVWLLKPREITLNQWNEATLKVITGGFNTKVMDLGDVGTLSKQHLRCSRRGGIPGEKSNVFSGMRASVPFKKATYDLLGLPVPEKPPRHMVIFNRKGGRAFENIDEMEAVLKKHNVEYEIVSSHGTFKEQVETMSRAGVLMMAHGAAATNTIFQAHRSVLIEVFPYMRKRFGFMQIAQNAGQFYMPIFSWDKPWTDASLNTTEFINECHHLASISTNSVRTCDLAQKVAKIRVPIDDFERTVIDAFDTIGYRINL